MKPTEFESFLNQLAKDILVGRADQGVLEDFFVACGLWDSNNKKPTDYRIC